MGYQLPEEIVQQLLRTPTKVSYPYILDWAPMSISWIPKVPNILSNVDKKSNLMIACDGKKEEVVDILVKDKNIDFLIEDNRNKNALYYAIYNKNKIMGEKYVRILLQKCPELVTILFYSIIVDQEQQNVQSPRISNQPKPIINRQNIIIIQNRSKQPNLTKWQHCAALMREVDQN